MKQLVNFEHFKIINEAEEKLEACLNSISESIINEAPDDFQAKTKVGAALQNPIKFIKLKNNAKRYQKALVQQALNDLDFEKKKQAAGGEVDADKKEVLAAANKAKNQALSDKEKAIADRMTDLATSPGLQAVKTLAVSKAKVAAAEIALKGADGEESKQLKIRIKELNAKASKAQQEIKDYTKDEPAKKVEPESTQKEEPEQQELPPTAQAEETPADDAEETSDKKESETIQLSIDKKEQELKGIEKEAEGSDYGKKQNELEAEIKRLNDLPDDEGKDKARELDKEKTKLKDEYKEGTGKELATKHAAIENEIRELKEALKKAKEKESAPKKESAKYIGESVSDKFRHLMAERLK